MNAYEKEIDEKGFEDTLNEIYEPVDICGMTFDQGRILRELDPIAFRCAMADEPVVWVCGECDAEFEDQDEAEECCKDD